MLLSVDGGKLVHRVRLLVLSLLFIGLTSCQTSPPVGEPGRNGEIGTPEQEQTLGPRLRKAIVLLETGQETVARGELQTVLVDFPDSKRAKNLLQQIDADPEAQLGKQHFSYKLKYGDSLSTVAERFLGDPLKFYILAKYNGIDNPKAVSTGQIIKVPGDKPEAEYVKPQPLTPVETRTEQERIAAMHSEVMQFSEAGNYMQAIARLESGLLEFPDDTKGKSLLVRLYSLHAQNLIKSSNNQAALEVLKKAFYIEPENVELVRLLANVTRTVSAETQYQRGQYQLGIGDLAKAYDAFTRALALNPDYKAAKDQIATIRPDVITYLHKQAMTKYRQQQLDQAIELWDKVLEIDPNHLNAQVHRSQAQDLKIRLEKLNRNEQN